MEFINPNMLWGLIGLLIPIAIHLLQLKRYKTVYFSDIRFLQQVQRSARKQQRLRHWLILAARLLFWGALAIAFALPFLPDKDPQHNDPDAPFVLYVDLSPSMTRTSSEGPLWLSAIENAKAFLASQPGHRQFYVVTPAFDGSDAVPLTREAAFAKLSGLQPQQHSATWQDLQDRIATYGLRDTAMVYLFTDGQSKDVEAFKAAEIKAYWYPILIQASAPAGNTTIDSVWLENPLMREGQEVQISFSLRRYGNAVNAVPVELWINGELRGATSFDLEENTLKTGRFSFRAGGSSAMLVSIRVDDPEMGFDNHYELVIPLKQKLRVLYLSEEDALPLERVFGQRDDAELASRDYGNIPYAQLGQWDLIVLDSTAIWPEGLADALRVAVDGGSSIFILPAGMREKDARILQIAGYGEIESGSVSSLNVHYDDPFFGGVFYKEDERMAWPDLPARHPISGSAASWGASDLLHYSDGSPSLLRYSRGLGQIYQWDIRPAGSAWEKHPMTAPLFFQMAIFKEQPAWISFPLEDNHNFTLSLTSEHALQIAQDSLIVIPGQQQDIGHTQINTHHPDLKAGFAAVIHEGDTVAALAYHLNGKESEMKFEEAATVNEYFRSMGIGGSAMDAGNRTQVQESFSNAGDFSTLSNWWIALAILCLLLEMFLWRRPKS